MKFLISRQFERQKLQNVFESISITIFFMCISFHNCDDLQNEMDAVGSLKRIILIKEHME
jgi:hypothetical protein